MSEMKTKFSQSRMALPVILLAISFLTTGCVANRTDAKAIAESFFRALMSKDYQKVQDLMGSGGSVPSRQVWNDGSFIQDYTQGEEMKTLWMKGAVSGYAIDEIVFSDPVNPSLGMKEVSITFILSGKKFSADTAIERRENEWYPIWTRILGGGVLLGFREPKQ